MLASSLSPLRLLTVFAAAAAGCGSDDAASIDGAPPPDAVAAIDAAGIDARVAMAVAATIPADGAEGMPVDLTIRIVFTQPVDAETLSIQPAWGACDEAATVHLSSDDFTTCVGGALTLPEATVAEIAPHGSVLSEEVGYRIKVAATVADTTASTLGTDYVQATGFTTAKPPCTAIVDPSADDTTGAACVEPAFRDNGDGTVTDMANKLLWTRCSVDGAGALKNGDDFGCVAPVLLEDYVGWERAVALCDQLEHAGRSDWILPDVARLKTLIADGGDPAIDPTAFPNADGLWHHTASTHPDPRSRWAVMFGYGGYTGTGYGGKARNGSGFVRCVAGARSPRAPELNPLGVSWIYSDRIGIYVPSYRTVTVPTPTRVAYIGIDGTIEVTGTTVMNALAGPIDVSAPATYSHEFGSLSAGTDYRVIVVAENEVGSSVAQVATRTGPIAPTLAPLGLSETADGITLSRPGFVVAGSPTPTVLAYLGVDGVISATGPTVTGSLRGPIDVSSIDHTFAGLTDNTVYRVIVVAQNTTGYSVQAAVYHLGQWIDNHDGSVYDPRTHLTWRKCSAGQTWSGAGTNACNGAAAGLRFCHEADNDCNGGTATGLLGPPWLDATGGADPYGSSFSTAWDACRDAFAGRADWRVPTKDELRGTVFDADTFPGTSADRYWSANSTTAMLASAGETDNELKTETNAVRCVAPGP